MTNGKSRFWSGQSPVRAIIASVLFLMLIGMVTAPQEALAAAFQYDENQVVTRPRSGENGTARDIERPGANWFLYGIESGERGDKPCVLRLR